MTTKELIQIRNALVVLLASLIAIGGITWIGFKADGERGALGACFGSTLLLMVGLARGGKNG